MASPAELSIQDSPGRGTWVGCIAYSGSEALSGPILLKNSPGAVRFNHCFERRVIAENQKTGLQMIG